VLHAVRLGFEHPDSGEHVEYESTYPDDLARALDVVRDATGRNASPAAGRRRDLRRARRAVLAARARPCPRCRPASTRRRGRGVVGGWDLDAWTCWVAEADGACGLRAGDRDWLDTSTSRPTPPGRGRRALLDLVKALAPPASACGSSRATSRPALLRPRGCVELERTDGSANEERAPDIRMAWPGPTRWRSSAADRRGRRAARRPAGPARGPDPACRPLKAPRARPPRERRIAEAMAARAPRSAATGCARIVHAIVTRVSTRRAVDAACPEDCRCALPRWVTGSRRLTSFPQLDAPAPCAETADACPHFDPRGASRTVDQRA
jgi:hypothetical protein